MKMTDLSFRKYWSFFLIFFMSIAIFYGFNLADATGPEVTDAKIAFDSIDKNSNDWSKTQYPNGTTIATYDLLNEKLTIFPNGTKILFHMTLTAYYEKVIQYPNETYSFQSGGRNYWDKLSSYVSTYYPDGKFRLTHIDSGEVDTTYPEPSDVQIYGSSSPLSNTLRSTHSFQNGTTISDFWNGTSIIEQPQMHQTSQIPSWIKNNARYWSDGSLTDKDFATGIGYLVQKKIISVNVATNQDGTILINDNLSIPKWIKNNAKYWSEGSISDSDFTSGIEFMVNQKIISFSEPSILSQIESETKTPPTVSDKSITDHVIHVQSKHGWYVDDNNSHGGFTVGGTGDTQPNGATFTPNDVNTNYYDLYTNWVLLKSQNQAEFKTAHIRLTSSDGQTKEYDSPIVDGVIQQSVTGQVAGTYVFEITNIDGIPLMPQDLTDTQIEIVIPNEKTVTPPPSVQTTPTVPNNHPLTEIPLGFTVPSQIVQEATSSSGAIVSFTTSFSSPGADSTHGITCNPPSGSQFPLGNTIVTCTEIDFTNQNTLKKSFTVTVRDTTPPAISPFNPHNDTPDDSGAVVYFTTEAIDLVDGPVLIHCDHQSGTKFPMGDTIVTCTADDSKGNHASRAFKVSITKS